MLQQVEFNPEYQFHVLLHFPDADRSVAVVPNVPDHRSAGSFLVVDQGRVMGQLVFNDHKHCIGCKGNISPAIVSQLETEIKGHYYYS